jgi:hypothetical protein
MTPHEVTVVYVHLDEAMLILSAGDCGRHRGRDGPLPMKW